MPRRFHSSDLVASSWGCERCRAGGTGKNSQALAAQHHDRKGHRTWAETTRRIIYGAISSAKSATQGSML